MTAFVTEQGLGAATVQSLHHHLSELVVDGELDPFVHIVDLRILGPTWCYRISGSAWNP